MLQTFTYVYLSVCLSVSVFTFQRNHTDQQRTKGGLGLGGQFFDPMFSCVLFVRSLVGLLANGTVFRFTLLIFVLVLGLGAVE